MNRLLILCPESIRRIMAGMGIRCWETARSLSADFEVTLGIPNEPAEAAPARGFRLARYASGNVAELAGEADAVLTLGHASDLYFDTGVTRPLIVDLYDPFPIENLNYTVTLGREPYYRDRATLERQLRHADLFLCSSAEQRLFYLGMLFALGRLNPETYSEDPSLESLIRVVPFGVPASGPVAGPPLLRGVSGIGEEDPVILFGGVYEWYDPITLLEALPALLERFGDLRVVFTASPHPDSTPQETLQQVVALARSNGWLDRHVFVVPWVSYEQRGSFYREATLAVVLHHHRFETEVSMRTRVIDYLWAGLPVIATQGGGADRLLRDHDMGRGVPAGDPEALAEAVAELLDSPQTRERMAARGRRWASDHTWDHVLEPLRRFVAAPYRDPHKGRYAATAEGTASGSAEVLRAARRRLGRWLDKGRRP